MIGKQSYRKMRTIYCPEGAFLNVGFNPNTGVFVKNGLLNKTRIFDENTGAA